MPNEIDKNMLYSIEEVAEMLKVSVATIRRRVNAGKIEHFRDGRLIRISQNDIEKYMAKNHINPLGKKQ